MLSISKKALLSVTCETKPLKKGLKQVFKYKGKPFTLKTKILEDRVEEFLLYMLKREFPTHKADYLKKAARNGFKSLSYNDFVYIAQLVR